MRNPDLEPEVPVKLLPFFKYVRREYDGKWSFVVKELWFDPCAMCMYAGTDRMEVCNNRCPNQTSICLDPTMVDDYFIAGVTQVVIGDVNA